MRNTKPISWALIFLAFGAGRAPAEADGPDFYRVTGVSPDDVLNIRAVPKPNAAKLGVIAPDATCIRNLGCQGGLSFKEHSTLSKAEQAVRLKQNPRWCRVGPEYSMPNRYPFVETLMERTTSMLSH